MTHTMPRMRYRDISGVLLLDKPQGLSSNQALQRARHLFNAEKAGHTGSLDPLATGLLPVCFGEATKIAGYLLGARKAYLAQCQLGATTTTDDADGAILQTRTVPTLDAAMIEAALRPLRGHIVQTPPAYSAIKQGGVALYKRARRGEIVDVPSREVDVFRLDALDHEGTQLHLHVECGSGTYVRSIVRDLGEALGCGAHLTSLRRIWVAPFVAPQMYTLDQLAACKSSGDLPALDALLLPLEQALTGLPALLLSPGQAVEVKQGKQFAQTSLANVALARALDGAGRLIALVEVDADGMVRVRRGFNQIPAAAGGRMQM